MNSETSSRMSSASASSVVSAGCDARNRARCVVELEVRRERAGDPLERRASVPGLDGTTRARVPSTAKVASRAGTSNAPSRMRSEAPRPLGSSETAERAVLAGSVATSAAQACRRERRLGVAEPHASRPVEQPLDPSRGRARLRGRDDGPRRGTIESSTAAAACAARAGARRGRRPFPHGTSTTRIGVVLDDDAGVARRVAEAAVESGSRAGRPERARAGSRAGRPVRRGDRVARGRGSTVPASSASSSAASTSGVAREAPRPLVVSDAARGREPDRARAAVQPRPARAPRAPRPRSGRRRRRRRSSCRAGACPARAARRPRMRPAASERRRATTDDERARRRRADAATRPARDGRGTARTSERLKVADGSAASDYPSCFTKSTRSSPGPS